MPRLLDADHCPHCGEGLPERDPDDPSSVCPSCGGSLQQRYLKAGCISSAPRLLVIGLGLWLAWIVT